ncbi:hypothetical protein HYH02_007056 [Chlamydomonas schloesseri]|uniref:Rhodanese domain-containing protein n=1 Tax=Chlamydomonas schloesseri TaxID=2026947 RepID=A0A836B5Q1_9CHLO|nr:hypothetical protein HYH02_007056 [Chlamydomonas schloesseri]|eukprot:KAG2448029.1 hypothetical protein HYH02_007056 [Chlamydomonas schloesseri]
MSWLWTFGRVPELDSAGINAVSERIRAMSEKERVQPDAPRIIDVRTRGEFEGGHIAGAVHASFLPPWSWPSSVEPILAGGVNHGTPLYVICLSAHRSIGALKWLRERGYKNVKQLKGGMQAWRAAKMPEVTEAPSVDASGSAGAAAGDSNDVDNGASAGTQAAGACCGAGGQGGGCGSTAKPSGGAGCCQAQPAGGTCGGAAGGGSCGSGASGGKEGCGRGGCGAAATPGAAEAPAPEAAPEAGGACCQKKKGCGGGGGCN